MNAGPVGRPAHVLLVVMTLSSMATGPVATADDSPLRIGSPSGSAIAGVPPSDQSTDVASNSCVGTISRQPDRTTLLSIQGARGSDKTVAMLVGIAPNGSIVGVHNGSANGRWWFYDVDRLDGGNLLLSTTVPGESVIEEIDPTTGEHVSTKTLPDVFDSHDADLINGDELLINDMSRDGDDRILVYNLTTESVVWEYRFEEYPEQFPHDGGGEYGGDWTHNNDVEQIRPGVFMVSVRNFDQAVAINRSTKDIEWRLGSDDDYSVLNEQHNPDYIRSETGPDSVLVADSLNDRVVEYARENGSWNRTWVLRGGGLNEPRDADRLPNGNTLVSDRRGDRLLEVTPRGQVVWEVYAPWQPYDAERLGTGDESSPPTARGMNATGVYEMRGSAGVNERQQERCYSYLTGFESGGSLIAQPDGDDTLTSDRTPGDRSSADGTETDGVLGTPSNDSDRQLLAAGGILALVIVISVLLMYRSRYR